jgi:hypothetical protein
MKTLLALAALALVVAEVGAADRIESMNTLERCIYRARLAAAGAYTKHTKGAEDCQGIKILWHGDETANEIEYVKRWICAGFEQGTNPVSVGDAVFEACKRERDI